MKRFHVHLGVDDLAASIRFYSGLFGQPPTVEKGDYAKWMVEDPRINFAISRRGGPDGPNRVGLNHLGLQVDGADELAAVRAQFAAADATTLTDEPDASCCYAQSDKHWVRDPQGIAWEGYHSLRAIEYFDGDAAPAADASACCMPAAAPTAPAAVPAPTACCAPATGGAPATGAVSTCCTPASVAAPATGAGKCCA
jgi:catechol 2,3-dioxygenase-like lactoylglutathione lyase family enzyme